MVTHRNSGVMMDVKDWNETLTESEKNLVGNILLGFGPQTGGGFI